MIASKTRIKNKVNTDMEYYAHYDSQKKEVIIGYSGEAISVIVSCIGLFPWETYKVSVKNSNDCKGYVIKQNWKKNVLNIAGENLETVAFDTGKELFKILKKGGFLDIENIKALRKLSSELYFHYQNVYKKNSNAE